jgi:para-aminobenzoate synthetase / 4-amino-4-deoxychorismate lyase
VIDAFVLLDDCHASAAAPTSRLYSTLVCEHRCTDPQTLDATWAAVAAEQARGLHAVVMADYEWGAKLLQAGHVKLPPDDASCLRVLMFERLEFLSADGVAQWLAAQDGWDAPSPAGVCELQASVRATRFNQDIARIRQLIGAGETSSTARRWACTGACAPCSPWPLAFWRPCRKTTGCYRARPSYSCAIGPATSPPGP